MRGGVIYLDVFALRRLVAIVLSILVPNTLELDSSQDIGCS